ncbi:hypothetical protein GW17_00043038 [Ensete ventricosum]|nr:hypothetical protein GW17_00043038 [Ensete ventricosum]
MIMRLVRSLPKDARNFTGSSEDRLTKRNEERGQPAMARPPTGAADHGLATCKGIAHRGGNHRRARPLATQRPQEQPAARAGATGHGLATCKGTARRGGNR